MCRMFAFTGQTESLKDLLLRFQKLSIEGKSTDGRGHRDGWGIGFDDKLFKRAECAANSTEYVEVAEMAANASPRTVVAHLRKASPGTPVTEKEAHPFKIDNFLFCHNGSIKRVDNTPLGEELDSILFFRRILKTSLKEAVRHFWNFKYTSLCCLLTDGRFIWAYRDFTEKEDYYTLYYLMTEECVLFCSEPIKEGEWTLLRNRELVTISPDRTLQREFL